MPMRGDLEQEVVGAIDRIQVRVVRLPLVKPFGTSVHTWTCKEALLLRLEADGLEAWGECVADPDPYYSYETTRTARHIIQDFLVPLLDAKLTLGELDQRFRHVRGHCMAKATVENALLDLAARRKGIPLHELLGWPRRPIPSGISIGLQETLEELLAAVEEAVAQKYHRVKMKIMHGRDVAWVAAVRERFPGIALMVDANGDYRLEEAAHLRQLDAFGLTMIEQPLSYTDIHQHCLLQRELATPICLDESIHGLEDAATAMDLGCRIINVKQGRVGGLMESARIARLAVERGVDLWSGGMDETGIGRAVNIHLQALQGFTLPGDTSETRRYFSEDLVDPPVVLDAEGWVEIPEGPGIGVRVAADRLEKYTLSAERIL